jgi:predicted nucleic acid-binding protein
MIIIDTNVISEVMRERPSGHVISWLNGQNAVSLFITTVTVGEVLYGLSMMPQGRRLDHLRMTFEGYLRRGFGQRVLAYDEASARAYADVMAIRRRSGRPLDVADGQIAAIARMHGYAIATRNTRDFDGVGLELINPFEA